MSHQLIIPGFPEPRKASVVSQPAAFNPSLAKPGKFEPLVDCFSIGPSQFTLFTDLSPIRGRSRQLAGKPAISVTRILNTGHLSRSAASRFKRSIDYINLIAKEKTCRNDAGGYFFKMKLAFITLTLPSKQQHSDNYLKQKLLEPFLDACKKRWPSFSYVWRAETQTNGNLHFHIITDHFVPKDYVNYRWKRILWGHGYMQAFHRKNPTMEAPCAEIRKVRNDHSLGIYMRKYLVKGLAKQTVPEIHAKIDSCKNRLLTTTGFDAIAKLHQQIKSLYNQLNELKKRKVMGKLWGCSSNLLLKPMVIEVESLSETSWHHVFSQPILLVKEYFSVFKVNQFKRFLHGFSRFDFERVRDYFKQLFQEVPIPVMVYSTTGNYSYR